MALQQETLVKIDYSQNQGHQQSYPMGMRQMQARAFEKRESPYLLIKAPPACGKSRALMYLALDKLFHQGIKKVIVAVPQMAIGSSFKDTELKSSGFFANWHVENRYNLCTPGGEQSKSDTVIEFMQDPQAQCLICAHPTLIYFYQKIKDDPSFKDILDKSLIAIDEFHHVSAEEGNRLGEVIHSLMNTTKAQIIAMTGSYFRGDQVPVLSEGDESKFDKITYTYYEQLSSYKYLKSISINYAFYEGVWTDAISEALDPTLKTIIHIPNVNSRESTKDKINEVGEIIDFLGKNLGQDPNTGIISVKRADGTILRVADLVSGSETGMQATTLNYLRTVTKREDVDIIIALGMAKEGFDWPWCEHALTVGYRNSLTEVVQIIGRATRDCEGKTHATFTNLIAKPDALTEDVEGAVDSLLKAISLSLLMEQVLAPNVHFRVRGEETKPLVDDQERDLTFIIDDTTYKLSPDAKRILDEDLNDLVSKLINDPQKINEALVCKDNVMQLLTEGTIPAMIEDKYAQEFTDEELEIMTKAIALQIVAPYLEEYLQKLKDKPKSPDGKTDPDDNDKDQGSSGDASHKKREPPKDGSDTSGDNKPINPTGSIIPERNDSFIKVNDKFLNVDDFDFSLILKINPFQKAYEYISRNLDPKVFKAIQDRVIEKRAQVSDREAFILWPSVENFVRENGVDPNPNSPDPYERRLGEVLAYMRRQAAKKAKMKED